MKISKLYSSILKGTWAIEPRFWESMHPVILGLFDKNMSLFDDNESKNFMINVIAANGNRMKVNAVGSDSPEVLNMFTEIPKGSIAIIPITGAMVKYDTLCSYGTNTLSSIILDAVSSGNISGIILETDSGGGSVDSISPLVFAINKAKEAGIYVLALADMAASAAYYAISYADYIMAANDISSEFGSIGVMISFQDVQPYYEKLGVKFHKIYATESSHKNQEFELALQGKYEMIKTNLLSPLAVGFTQNVRNNRNGKINLTVPGILNGRMFFAKEAIQNGMIDSIGDIDKAIELIKLNTNP